MPQPTTMPSDAAAPVEVRMVEADGQLLRVGVRAGTGRPPLIFNGTAPTRAARAFTAALGVSRPCVRCAGVGGSPAPKFPYRLWQPHGWPTGC
jgi:hypothetical protein